MASNLDYLDPSLLPLEARVQAYLDTEKALRRATSALPSAPTAHEHPPTVASLRHDLNRQRDEIMALLPVRDEWVKINLGYGPSRVGAWQVPATSGTAEHYELRVVH